MATAAELLILAYAKNDDGAGSIDWDDLDAAFEQAKKEYPGLYLAYVRELKKQNP